MTPEQLREAIRLTAKIHEKSWAHQAGDWNGGKYLLDVDQAAMMACRRLKLDPEFAKLISIALNGWWNDTLEWAEKFPRATRWRKLHRTPRCQEAFYLSDEFRHKGSIRIKG